MTSTHAAIGLDRRVEMTSFSTHVMALTTDASPGDNTTMLTSQLHHSNATHSNVSHDYSCVMLQDPADVELSHKVYLFASLFFITMGLAGNSMSILVFSSREMSPVSSNTYLLALSISDSLYLVSVFLTKTINTLRCFYFIHVPMDLTNRSDLLCKSLQYIQDMFSDYSTCLIMAFTLERYIAVYLPIKFKEICTVSRARTSCMLIFLVIAVFIAPYHFMYIKRYERYGVCSINFEKEHIFTAIYVAEMLVFRIVPVVIIVTLNVFIIVKVTRVTAEMKRRRSLRTPLAGNGEGQGRARRTRKEDKSLQLTIMLIVVSTSYVLVFIPVLIHFVMLRLQRTKVIRVTEEAIYIAQNYTRSLYISGFAINFFLYTISGRVFREQLEFLLCRGSYRPKVAKESAMGAVSRNGYTGMVTTGETDV